MRLEIEAPDRAVGDVLSDLATARRAKVLDVTSRATRSVIIANAPLETLLGYSTALRSLTQGEATFAQAFAHGPSVGCGVAALSAGRRGLAAPCAVPPPPPRGPSLPGRRGRRRRAHPLCRRPERPLAPRCASRPPPGRATSPGAATAARARLAPLSQAGGPVATSSTLTSGPPTRPRRDERREAVEQHVHRGARRVVDAVKELERRGPAPRDLLVADRREPSGQRRDVALAVAHDGSIPVERVAERQRKVVRDDDGTAAGRERLVEAARRRGITRRNQAERRVARPGRRVQEVPARSVARRAFHDFPTHLRNAPRSGSRRG